MTLVLNGTTGVSSVDGSASTPAIQGTDSNTGVFFPAADTVAIATGGSERLRADSSGNVGIGTSSPAYKLDVNGGINSQTGFVYLGNANVYANYRSGNNDVVYSGASGFFYYQNITSTYHAWYTGNSERARIDSSGNLLVGKTATGTATQGFGVYSTGDFEANAGNNPAGQLNRTNDGTILGIRRSNTTVGTISVTTTATAYNTSSDYRLKHDIQPMTGALARVALLKPCTYTWKVNGSAGEGFIAHELQEVVPDAVNGVKDAVDADGNIVPQSIDTSFLVATLTAAIQEQQALIESLTARIAALEAA